MNSTQFKSAITSVSDQLIDYHDNIHTRRVSANVKPGYLKKLLPGLAPEDGEAWDDIQQDIEAKIMPGMTHWNSPDFMAYFPAPTSYPSMLGELYSSALTVSAFNWECAPAVTELEVVVMDWLVKMFNLPSCFLSTSTGGGAMQGTTSEAILSLMVAARERYLNDRTSHLSGFEKEEAIAQRRLRMVALGSEASHSCTQKAAMILGIRYRSVPVSIENGFSMTGAALAETLQQCHMEGLEPFYLTATLGTTATCAVDRFDEVARVLRGHQIWVHVDAAYAGAALACEEYQHLTQYFEEFDSFSMSMSKWLLVNIDAVCCFIKNRHLLTDAMSITPPYLRNEASDSGEVFDFRHWGVPLSRRFRALKVWFVIRTYGVNGLRSYLRNHIRLGEHFASLIASRPDLFKIVTTPAYALTVISLVPRVPTVLHKFLSAKANEAKLCRPDKEGALHQTNGQVKTNGATSCNGHRKANGLVSTNGKPTINGNGSGMSNGEVKQKGVTAINGHAQTNGNTSTDNRAGDSRGSLTNGHTNTVGHGDVDSRIGNQITNGFHANDKAEPENVWISNGGPKPKKSPSLGESKANGVHSNGVVRLNGTAKVNGHSSIDDAPHIKEDPMANNICPMKYPKSQPPATIVQADSPADQWMTEYANMVTKEVYDLVNRRGDILLTSTVIGGLFVIRVNGANPKTEEKYMTKAFNILVETAEEVLGAA